jgi:hypothetical protein
MATTLYCPKSDNANKECRGAHADCSLREDLSIGRRPEPIDSTFADAAFRGFKPVADEHRGSRPHMEGGGVSEEMKQRILQHLGVTV